MARLAVPAAGRVCICLTLFPAVRGACPHAGAWLAWSFAGFWAIRLYVQWFVYQADLWRGKRMETFMHWWFTLVWTALAALFAACGSWQMGWFAAAS